MSITSRTRVGVRRWQVRFLAAAAVSATAVSLAAAVPAQAAGPVVIQVATTGDDANTGASGSPVATLSRAQELVRAALPGADAPITVEIAPGDYYLSQPLALTAEDSGTAQAPVTWRGTGDGVRISGGRALSSTWTPSAGDPSVMVTPVPDGIDFDELFVGGRRQVMARYPNFDESAPRLDGSTSLSTLNTRSAGWSKPTTGYVRGMHCHDWGSVSFTITGRTDNALNLKYIGDNNRPQDCNPTQPANSGVVMVENIKEELDAAGEWFLDKDAHQLYYKPAAGVDLATAKVETGELEQLVTVEGASAADPVAHVTFDNLDFQRTHRTMFGAGNTFEGISRGDWSVVRKAAIFLQNTEDVTVSNSSFTDLGSNAVFMSGYNDGTKVLTSRFRNSGGTDIHVVGLPDAVRNYAGNYFTTPAIDDLGSGPKSENYPRNILIQGNDMANNGHYEKQTSSVNIGTALDVTVKGNSLSDSPRACLNFSDTTWGGHVIQDNDIFDCVKGSGDNGSINAWGRSRFWKTGASAEAFASLASGVTFMGNTGGALNAVQARAMAKLDTIRPIKIDHNRFWHDGDWAIDLDDGSSLFELTNNLILKGGIKLRDGFDRTVRNNLLLNGATFEQVSYMPGGDIIENNVTYGGTPWKNCCQPDYAAAQYQVAKNLYWNAGKPVVVSQGGNQQLSADGSTINPATGWYAAGYDRDSMVADPKLAHADAIDRYDFTLAADSPALTLGYENFPMTFGAPGAALPPKAVLGANEDPEVPPRDVVVEKWMGADLTQIATKAEQSAYAIADFKGVKLSAVPATSDAGKGGLQANDLIRTINGVEVTTQRNTFWRTYNALAPGAELTLGVRRASTDVTVELTKTLAPEQLNNTAGVVYTDGAGSHEHWLWRGAAAGGAGAYLDDIDATQNTGDSWSLDFYGTGLDIISQVNSDLGDVELEIDGEFYKTQSFYNGSRVHQKTVLSITGLEAGKHTITGTKKTGGYMIVDAFKTHPQPLDETAPVVSVVEAPEAGATGWQNAATTVTATATDAQDPSPVLEVKLGSGDWTAYAAPVVFAQDGRWAYQVRARDAAGNLSEPVVGEVALDTSAPVSNAKVDQAARTVTIRSADALSGLDRIEYRIGSGAWAAYTAPLTVGNAETVVEYRGVDVAGNAEEASTAVVPAKADPAVASTTTVTLSPATVKVGSRASAVVTVTPVSGTAVPTGDVVLTAGGVEVGRATLSGGRATISFHATGPVGQRPLTATYAGDAAVLTSTGTAVLTVAKAATVVKAKAKVLKAARKAPKKAKVTVGVVTAGERAATVRIEVLRGKKVVKVVTVRLTSAGTATWTTPKLTKPGTYRVRVTSTGSATSEAATTVVKVKIKR